jgi:hypothetical protein
MQRLYVVANNSITIERMLNMSKNAYDLNNMILNDPRVADLCLHMHFVASKLAWIASMSRDGITLPPLRVLSRFFQVDTATVLSELERLVKAGLVFRDADGHYYFKWFAEDCGKYYYGELD